MINYLEGNIIDVLNERIKLSETEDVAEVWVPHVVNDENLIGSGVAKALFERWPDVKKLYHAWFAQYPKKDMIGTSGKAKLGQIQVIETGTIVKVVNMVAQSTPGINWYPQIYAGIPIRYPLPPIRMQSLEECMVRITHEMQRKNVNQIITVKFGSGLAGGRWSEIEALIEKLWVDCGISVTVVVPKE